MATTGKIVITLNLISLRKNNTIKNAIIISTTKTTNVDYAKFAIRKMLREQRGLLKDQFDNFQMVSYENVTKKILQTTTILKFCFRQLHLFRWL